MEKDACLPVTSAIIERNHQGKKQILIATRDKPNKDSVYSGTIEIPAGKITKYENVYEAMKREVKEETGLTITKIHPDIKTKTHSVKDDGSFAFMPFCCQQQLKNGKPWIGFVFICEVEDTPPIDRVGETKDVRWIDYEELKEIFESTPEKIFTLQLSVLDYYFNNREKTL